MKPCLAAIFALALAHTARADDFTARMAAGHTAAATAEGSAVSQAVLPVLADIDNICDPRGTVLPLAELGPFDIVGDITRHGNLINLEARPQNPLTACFTANLAKRHFFPPNWPGDYPLYIHLGVSN
jgi:hypothetical protein